MPPTLEQLSLALADSLDDRPLGMETNDLTVRLLFGEPTPTMASPEDEGSRTGAAKIRSQPSYVRLRCSSETHFPVANECSSGRGGRWPKKDPTNGLV